MSVYVIFNIKGHAGEMKVPQKKKRQKTNKQVNQKKVKKVKQRNRMR